MDSTEYENPGQPYLNELLSFMIKKRQNELVEETLQRSNLYHIVDPSGATLLHYCARYDNEIITQFLLDQNCNFNAQDHSGNTPLITAIEGTNEAVIQILIAVGADIFLSNSEKKSALHILCTNHDVSSFTCKQILREFRRKCSTSEEAAEKLIDAGFQIDLAAYSLDFKVIELMLARGCPVDSVHPLRKRTAMHVAVHYADLDTVKLLLKNGADAKVLDIANVSPLRYLYQDDDEHHPNKVEILRILLSLGVSPTNCDSTGFFDMGPILYAGNHEMIRLILQSQKDFTVRDKKNGETALHYLARNSNPEAVREFKLHTDIKYDVDAVSIEPEYSVLYIAAVHGNAEMVRFLLCRGAEPDLMPNQEYSPLYYAYTRSQPHIQNQYDKCVELLFQYGADPQMVLMRPSGEVITVFDFALRTNEFYRVKPAIAQLSLREKSGIPFGEYTRDGLDSNLKIAKYLDECRRLMGEKIFKSITLHKLLTSHPNVMERYLNNKKLLQKLALFNRRHNMKSAHTYLFNTLRKGYREGKEYKKLKVKATGAISKIFGGRIHKNHLIVEKVISYLKIHSLRQLARSSRLI